LKCILLFSFILFIIPALATENLKNWQQLSGHWDFNEEWITPSKENNGIITRWAIARVDLNEESRWEEISSDFQIGNTMKDPQFGLLLNVKSKDNYQLLRICNSTTNPVIQMLRWQYGHYRMWQEIKLPGSLSSGTTYRISVCRAPMVDTEDWRQWKILLSDKTTKQILLKQGIENEQPTFGMGNVGLYAETTGIRFGNFTVESKKHLTSSGTLRLAPLFNDGMVLQQQAKIKIWGKANPEEKIQIELAGRIYHTASAKSGDWKISIPPLKAQVGLVLKVIAGKDSVIIQDIAVGEVWMASGQSNMEMRVWQSDVAALAKEVSKDEDLRFFLQPQWPSPHSCFDGGGEWMKADSVSVKGWSAVALSFALELRKKLHVPVGIISSNWGGTAVESWIPRSRLAKDSITSPILKRMNQYQIALEKSDPIENRFPWCWDLPGQRHTPGDLFNGMIAPHIHFAIKGVIWYQGESNSYRARQYEHLFPMLISSWRELWQNPKMGFYFVHSPDMTENNRVRKLVAHGHTFVNPKDLP